MQAGSLLTLGQSQWKAEKSGDQDAEGHLLLSGHTDTQIADVLHEQTHGSRTAHSLCLLSTAIQSPGPRGGGRSEGVSGGEATVINSGAIAEEFALTVTQNHHGGRVMDHLQRAGLGSLLLGAMSTQVSTVRRVHWCQRRARPTATCAPPRFPTPSHHARGVHAALLDSPAMRVDRNSRPAARYSSSRR